ncbi:hypothetical protein KBB05_02530 [Patescibacteria group bacterium]|nr:hypothetical protein [Patescibacteria group bacterium]
MFDDSLSWDKLGEEERGPIGSILKENKSMIEEILTHLVNNQQTYSISSGYLKTSAHQEGMIKITETDDHSFAVSIDPLIEAVLQI